MAKIRPFSALRYDTARVGRPADVMAPPYDVVDAERRRELAGLSEHNSIHFILPEGEGESRYDRAAQQFRATVEAAIVRDAQPGFYVYHQRFESQGRSFTRKGFIGLIELTRFGHGPVLAHERTLSGPKADRLKLMRACAAHLELVFGMFSDPEGEWEAAVDPHLGEPVWRAEFEGVEHVLWRVAEPASCERLTTLLASKRIYIADGHHRYETMCSFRDELAAQDHRGAAFGMIYLSNLDDPGLVVLPTHRFVHGVDAFSLSEVISGLLPHFSHDTLPLPKDAAALANELAPAQGHGASLGLCVPGTGVVHRLRLRPDFDPIAAGLGDLAEALRRLDVVLLHELVFERALSISKAAQAAKTNLGYEKSTDAALSLAAKDDGHAQLVCFMNATPVADVKAVCDSGEVMPQKSTFFYPKIPNGLAFYDLRDPHDGDVGD